MNVEFHYYAVYFLALRAGFRDEDAYVIAYSSQFVDHNVVSYRVATPAGEYAIEPTQNYGFWDDAFPREVYLPFHFFPGVVESNGERRLDARKNPLGTSADSPRVRELLIDALASRNLYRVGIALHTYADSWAHQNFSGVLEQWNRADAGNPIPPIGHAQFLGKPDNPALEWDDPRLVEPFRRVSNRDRFFRAARQIYKFLATFNRRSFDDLPFVEEDLDRIVGHPGSKPTAERISDFIINDSLTPYRRDAWLADAVVLPDFASDEELFRGYSRLLWLRDAVVYRSGLSEKRPVAPRDGFFDSHLYRWHEASKEHRRVAARIISDLTIRPT